MTKTDEIILQDEKLKYKKSMKNRLKEITTPELVENMIHE